MEDASYKGPSKLFSTVGGWFVGGLIGGLVALPIALVAFPGAAIVAGVIGIASQITGAIYGYQHAERGEQQYYQTQAALTQVAVAHSEEMEHSPSTTRFTDHIKSKGQHGSYAETIANESAAESTAQTR